MTDPVIPENPRRTPLVASAGQTNFQFDFDGVATVGDLRVYVNGEETTDFTLTANTKTVTLGTPSVEDDSVVIEGQLAIQRLRDYPRGGELQTARLNPEMNFIVRVMQELRRDVNRAITFSKAQIGASNILPLFTEVGHALVSGPNGIEISDVKVTELDEALQAAEDHADAAAQAVAAAEGVRDETETVRDAAIAARDVTLGYRDETIAARDVVQALSAGMKWRGPVKAATTANITLSGAQTIDTVSIVAGDRVLVKNQSTASQNGVYVAASGAWSRAVDADSWAELVSQVVAVEEGSDPTTGGNRDMIYVCTVNQGGTLGSTSVTWSSIVVPVTLASQVEAEAGSENTKTMTALRVKQAINANAFYAIKTFTASGTYTPDAKMKFCKVTLVAAGGDIPSTSSNPSAQSSAGWGGKAIKSYSAADIGASVAFTIGSTCTFKSMSVTKGANGGALATSGTRYQAGGAGGTASGGDINITGRTGAAASVSTNVYSSGLFAVDSGIGTSINPVAGVEPGEGARGSVQLTAGSMSAASGGPAILIVEEFG